MSEKMKPWFVTEPGGPMGQWPGVMEQDGRIIAFAVPDKTTAHELINLRAQLAAATARAEAVEAALRRSTNVTPGKETCVLMTLDKWTEWHMRLVAATKRAEDAEAVLATIPMAPLLRIVEAILMGNQPLQFDMDAAERWLKTPPARV